MAKQRKRTRRQDGFTLIEIIAVLVILGILAVVAIPKFFDMQKKARDQAALGLVAAAQSQLSLFYANSKLDATNYSPDATPTDICGNVAISSTASEATTLTCDGTLASQSNITATVGADGDQQGKATGVWHSPEEKASDDTAGGEN